MEKKVGIVICNYNGKDFVVGNIESLFKQEFQSFDIIVVDNASTDGTAEVLEDKFGDKITILQNESNLGGAGGFNVGLRKCLSLEYEYIMMLDNDVILDSEAVGTMVKFLDENKDVGIVGAKVMIMDKPDYVQDFGNSIDFRQYFEKLNFAFVPDNKELPLIHFCDYIPTCAAMTRLDVLKRSGIMPEDNFIYFDDIELCYRIGLEGYKIAALGNAKVWHKGGFRKAAVNTFSRYYFTRNRLLFFAKYIRDDQIDDFVEVSLERIFDIIYGSFRKGYYNAINTIMYALDDLIHNNLGKADEYKIMKIDKANEPIDIIVGDCKKILLCIQENKFENLSKMSSAVWRLIETLHDKSKRVVIHLYCEKDILDRFYGQYDYLKRLEYVHPVFEKDSESYDKIFVLVPHVHSVEQLILPEIYIDEWCNCITNEDDYIYFRNTFSERAMFIACFGALLKAGIKNIRSNLNNMER